MRKTSTLIAAASTRNVKACTPRRQRASGAIFERPINIAAGNINAIGADAPGKQEISPALLRQSKIVIDDWAQASHSGEINVPLRRRQIRKKDIYAELGEIVRGKKKGRSSDSEITLFDSTGLAVQDIACAATVYKALADKGETGSVRLF